MGILCACVYMCLFLTKWVHTVFTVPCYFFLLCCVQSSVTGEKMVTFAKEEFKNIYLGLATLGRHPHIQQGRSWC